MMTARLFHSKMDGINIQMPWNSSESPLEYNYGSYGMGGAGSLSLDVSPTELKSMSVGYSGNYSTVGGQFTSVSPAPGGSWYSPSDGNVHILQSGEILSKVDPGLCVTYKFRLLSHQTFPQSFFRLNEYPPLRKIPFVDLKTYRRVADDIVSYFFTTGNRKNKRYTPRNNITQSCDAGLFVSSFFHPKKNIREKKT